MAPHTRSPLEGEERGAAEAEAGEKRTTKGRLFRASGVGACTASLEKVIDNQTGAERRVAP